MIELAAAGVFGLQAALMLVDEFYFHHKRGLPRWECIGHPLDTLSVFVCYATTVAFSPVGNAVTAYVVCAVVSCFFVTKDEFVHARLCVAAEHWLHAMLFILHPAVLGLAGLLWIRGGHRSLLVAQASLTLAFGIYQTVYWNRPWQKTSIAP